MKLYSMARVCFYRSSIFFLSIACLFNSADIKAWSFKGHSVIAQSAAEGLPKRTRIQIQEILKKGPWCEEQSRCLNAVAKASAWPDRIRDKSIAQLFSLYGSGQVPKALREYQNQNSTTWHFVNVLYLSPGGAIVYASEEAGKTKTCPPSVFGLLFEIWPKLLTSYRQSTDSRDKALVLAFILHLAADAYQPLHLLSGLDAECKGDKGGNGFCLDKHSGTQKRCKKNLHSLWDQGFGVFDSDLTVPDHEFDGNYTSLESAQMFLKPHLKFIYPKSVSEVHNRHYHARARSLTESASTHAMAHLMKTLNELVLGK